MSGAIYYRFYAPHKLPQGAHGARVMGRGPPRRLSPRGEARGSAWGPWRAAQGMVRWLGWSGEVSVAVRAAGVRESGPRAEGEGPGGPRGPWGRAGRRGSARGVPGRAGGVRVERARNELADQQV